MADPAQFSDPFWAPDISVSKGYALADAGKSIGYHSSEKPMLGVVMKVGGLGTIATKCSVPRGQTLRFIVRPRKPSTQTTLTLEVTAHSCSLYRRANDSKANEKVKGCQFPKGMRSAYLNYATSDPTTYWISVDRSNARLRYGQHLTNASMTYMQAQFDVKSGAWMDDLTITDVEIADQAVPDSQLRYNVLPVTVDLPPLVVSERQISLEELETYRATTFANLPPGCQNLYHNIAGPNITIESDSFPQLPEAIDQSCRDVQKLCGEMLKHKEGEFGDPLETYLRITVGDNLANSPGIPYVMEIWPPGHYSPIHDHGNASAVIKVLYGSIDCTWFDALQTGRQPQHIGNPVRLSKGDMTWLGERQYQIHQLKNNCKTVCITLQCYQFEDGDTVHYEKFDYVDDQFNKHQFVPNSDMAYGRFVQAMKAEWSKPASGGGGG